MSYSFSVRGSTSEDVSAKVSAELDKVVAAQPNHEADRDAAQKLVSDLLDVVPKLDDKDYSLSISGSLGWNGTLGGEDYVVTNASLNVSLGLVAKE